MNFATLTNLLTIVLCGAVLVQCIRMMRSISAFKQTDLPAMVDALEKATGQAQTVLHQFREVLARDAGPKLKAIAEGQAMAEELGVMIGIANATADRLLEVSRAGRPDLSSERDLAA